MSLNTFVFRRAIHHLTGRIPEELGKLTELRELALAINQLSGKHWGTHIVSFFGNMHESCTRVRGIHASNMNH